MSLTRLRTFIEVYRQRSISGAARSLNLTQPAVSQHINGLEVIIGKPLFDRTPQGVAPTTAADELAIDLGDSLETAEAALTAARVRSMDIAGVLQVVGHADFMAEVMGSRFLSLLQAGIKVRLQSGNGALVSSMILEGHCDLGITAHATIDKRLKSQKIYTSSMIPVASPQVAERINSAEDLSAALTQEPLLAYNLELSLVERWMRKNHLPSDSLTPSLVSQDLRSQRAMLASGFGWSVLPAFLCKELIDEGKLVELNSPVGTVPIPYYLVWAAGSLSKVRVSFAHQVLSEQLK